MPRKRKTSVEIDTNALPKISDMPLSIEDRIFLKEPAYSKFDNKNKFERKETQHDESSQYSKLMKF